MPEQLTIWFQTKHRCGHTSAMQAVEATNFDAVTDANMAAELVRLRGLPCRKCWIKEEGLEGKGTFCVTIPKGL